MPMSLSAGWLADHDAAMPCHITLGHVHIAGNANHNLDMSNTGCLQLSCRMRIAACLTQLEH